MEYIENQIWLIPGLCFGTGLLADIYQGFLLHRLWKLTKKWYGKWASLQVTLRSQLAADRIPGLVRCRRCSSAGGVRDLAYGRGPRRAAHHRLSSPDRPNRRRLDCGNLARREVSPLGCDVQPCCKVLTMSSRSLQRGCRRGLHHEAPAVVEEGDGHELGVFVVDSAEDEAEGGEKEERRGELV